MDVRGGSVTVRSEDRLLVYTAEHVRELEPAYAVTIHKSQGSEFPAVIIPVMDVPPKPVLPQSSVYRRHTCKNALYPCGP